ncbi:MAG: alpha-galactosidase [Verrucomicrobia bacterium]|jgi:alpha-galactosidase|nr:alpha-galactosidase [Verrucomicrobiota bacterium]
MKEPGGTAGSLEESRQDLDKQALAAASRDVRPCTPSPSDELRVIREWDGDACRLAVVNDGLDPVCVKEVAAFIAPMPYAADTPFYGEGYNMLSQYEGTLAEFGSITRLTDAKHYKFPQTEGFSTVYNLLVLYPENETVVLGFSSCRRFRGELRFNTEAIEIVVCCEGVELCAGETLELEEVFVAGGTDREELLAAFGRRIESNHPRLPVREIPTGWCSWYCYGDSLTEDDLFENLAVMEKHHPDLRFIQLDAGYQKWMGDWLTPHPNFPNGIQSLCHRIKDAGFEPALWVAPFIAEEQSEVLRDHPEWFIQNDQGKPLCSADVTFGGWRWAPWYMFDGTHPGAQDYIRHVFRTMREEWGCRYFKLDANNWGAMPWGHRYDPKATSIDAYRAGMQALLEGAGEDAFVLGSNAPMWPSIGALHGMRVSNDVSRRWETFQGRAQESFQRSWQNGRLWLNDPDCLVLDNIAPEIMEKVGAPLKHGEHLGKEEFSFHAAYILACGGLILVSERMMDLTDDHRRIIRKLLPPGGKAARFDDRTFRIGRIETDEGLILCLFNWADDPAEMEVPLSGPHDVSDYWTDEMLARGVNGTPPLTLAPRSARVLRCVQGRR